MTQSLTSTTVAKAVLLSFVEDGILEVKADHSTGDYMIRLEDLQDYVAEIPYDDLVEISLRALDRLDSDVDLPA